ncbi:unnamed protein product [Leptidea sinapis]|uniref:Uncharacterized protein n=1 Tax=Leptidea sinapis TaxID=189913 RepID=A0A5E4PU30_9NEOP|nr:unnamed protein product [Leptidea sinapis]
MSCFNDILYWRQSLILISMGLHSMGIGFLLSFPAALNAALLSTNTTDITATPDQLRHTDYSEWLDSYSCHH